MHSKKKVNEARASLVAAQSLLPKVERAVKSDNEIDAVRKDIHLIHERSGRIMLPALHSIEHRGERDVA